LSTTHGQHKSKEKPHIFFYLQDDSKLLSGWPLHTVF
jgi:hypothetical protein